MKVSSIGLLMWNKAGGIITNEKNVKIFLPQYGNRKLWTPRCDGDYGDGGAFPEIHLAQYPLGLGNESIGGNGIASSRDAGKIGFNFLASHIPKPPNISLNISAISDHPKTDFKKPNLEEKDEIAMRTKEVLEKLTSHKINSAMPSNFASVVQTQYLRYTPIHQGEEFNSGAKQRVIKMVESQIDPMEPPKFKINKKIPRGPPSPPAPILHSPSRKVSTKEQKEWKVPPCISNWKNAKGYTIPLDKRLAADGRGLQQLHINEKFAKMAEALYIADRKAREAVEARAQLEKKLAQKEKEKKEDMLRVMAQKAREERAGLRFSDDLSISEMRDRNELRTERHKERVRDKNISRAAPDKRLKLQKDRDRDITEQVALGRSAKLNKDFQMQFDQRLFDTTKGMSSGYNDDESYNLYDKPWRDVTSTSLQVNKLNNGENYDIYATTEISAKNNRFVPDKKFSGSERVDRTYKSGPVQFEKEDDPFGLDQFLNMAKKATKRADDGNDKKKEAKRYKF